MRQRTLLISSLGLLSVWFCFFMVGKNWLDPDFGWHIRLGNQILTRGIPRHDLFSYTMPSYPVVDHEWLINIAFAFLYPRIGMSGLAALFAGIAVLSGWIVVPKKAGAYRWLAMMLFYSVAVSRFGVRPQVLSWLFLAILLRLLYEGWKWWRYGAIPLFLIWANMHAGFAIGVMVSLVAIVADALESKKIKWSIWIVFGLGILATCVTPFGWRVWWEIYMTVSDRRLSGEIAEWAPFWAKLDLGFWFAYAGLIAILKVMHSQLKLWMIAISGFLFLLALSGIRHTPLAMLSTIPILTLGLSLFSKEVLKRYGKVAMKRLGLFYLLLVAIASALLVFETVVTYIGDFPETFLRYPNGAIVYIKTHSLRSHIFAPYDWGGFFDWQLPTQQVFIDGRMPSYRFQPPKGESSNAFDEYMQIIAGKNVQILFEKYGVHTVVWNNPLYLAPTGFSQLLLHLHIATVSGQPFLEELKILGWKIVYQDRISVIYTDMR